MSPADFDRARVRLIERDDDVTSDVVTVEYEQRHRGLHVVGSTIGVHVEEATSTVIGIRGSFLDVGGLDTTPGLSATRAAASVGLRESETHGDSRLVVWSAYRSGGDPAPRLAWAVPIRSGGGTTRVEYVDAMTSEHVHSHRTAAEAPTPRRTVWDYDGTGMGYGNCQRWVRTYAGHPWPQELEANRCGCSPVCSCPTCPAVCDGCRTSKQECALCVCVDPVLPDPVGCQSEIYRYDSDTGGCIANGDPLGEPNCQPEAQQAWEDLGLLHGYWASTLGRDSWNGTGGWMWGMTRGETFTALGVAVPWDVDEDWVVDISGTAYMKDALVPPVGPPNHWIVGHEGGHTLQQSTMATTFLTSTYGFHSQGAAAMESNADVQGYHYQGLELEAGVECVVNPRRHYTRAATVTDSAKINKTVGDCHAWLMSQGSLGSFSHYGVTVTPTTRPIYDSIWYRALAVYHQPDDDYFDWWNQQTVAAYDLYGFGSPFYAAQAAAFAIGSWTGMSSMGIGTVDVRINDRIAAIGTAGASRGPCIFYRHAGSTTQILWSCYTPSGWTTASLFNSTTTDPAATPPTVATPAPPVAGSPAAHTFDAEAAPCPYWGLTSIRMLCLPCSNPRAPAASSRLARHRSSTSCASTRPSRRRSSLAPGNIRGATAPRWRPIVWRAVSGWTTCPPP